MASTTTEEKRQWLKGVLQRHGPALRRYAARLTGDVTTADAVVLDTLRKLVASGAPPPEEKLTEWLFRVGRTSAVDNNRGKRPPSSAPGADEDDDAPAPKPGTGTGPRAKSGGAADPLHAALNKLNQVQQEVLRLKFQHGMNYREIGGILNLTVPNVGILIHGAMKQLRSNPQLRERIARL